MRDILCTESEHFRNRRNSGFRRSWSQNEVWDDDENPPKSGVSIYRVEYLPEGQAINLNLKRSFSFFYVHGQEERCDQIPHRFLSPSGTTIGNGYCSFGFYEGNNLGPIPMEIRGGWLWKEMVRMWKQGNAETEIQGKQPQRSVKLFTNGRFRFSSSSQSLMQCSS